ncbi:hypothetical protein FIBSPDRAFT_226190 [Athelia psychrophila]|uniref:Uncharacterized protein n=1 Tax=Athelia psychrophila TaxID=1759441 RepID=A0A166S8U1_9AGAM|nr:hypothetical protein FIBSPDRAFT_226190 [Fibularhizoctonia sp. CBS 109695]
MQRHMFRPIHHRALSDRRLDGTRAPGVVMDPFMDKRLEAPSCQIGRERNGDQTTMKHPHYMPMLWSGCLL